MLEKFFCLKIYSNGVMLYYVKKVYSDLVILKQILSLHLFEHSESEEAILGILLSF